MLQSTQTRSRSRILLTDEILTCSTRWSLGSAVLGIAVREFPAKTATGSDAVIKVPVRSARVLT